MDSITRNETHSLYLDNQQKVIGYARSHHAHMAKCFAELKEHLASEAIKVDKVFDYLKEAFSLDGFQFQQGISGPNILVQDNIERIEQLLESFYRQFKKVPKEQFFFYRMTITEDEIADLIEFWIKTDDKLFIEYEGSAQQRATLAKQKIEQQNTKPAGKNSLPASNHTGSENNEFIGSEDAVAKMLGNLLEQIRSKEAAMASTEIQLQRIQLQASINRLKEEVQTITSRKPIVDRKHTEATSQHSPSVSPSTKQNGELRRANLHILFDYYSKQNHITGVKATFDRIEHESNTINYPKLIHLLKDFNLYDEKEKTKVFPLFQKAAADYKALQLHEFEMLMPQLAHVLVTDSNSSDIEKQDIFFHRIFSSEDHHARLNFKKRAKYHGTGKAFNTRESNDFRIRPEQITYQFHIMPHSGKTVDEIQDELVKRREVKERYKHEVARQKEAINQKFLKKLSSVDPFNSSLVGLKNEGKEEHVAGINNLEAFRDASFNPKEFFKIPEDNDDDTFMAEYSMHASVDIGKRSQHLQSLRKDKMPQSPRKQTQQSQQSPPLDSPRRDRAKSIVEEISARAVELQKLQKSKNDSIMKILNSQPLHRRVSLGGAPASQKSRRH